MASRSWASRPSRRRSSSGRPLASLLSLVSLSALFGGTATAQSPPPPSSLPLQLTGVMADDKVPARSLCFIRCVGSGERHGALGIGDTACDVAEVKEIRDDVVVIRNLAANRLELLRFPPEARKSAERTQATTASADATAQRRESLATPSPGGAPSSTTVEVTKATVDTYLANINDLLQSALAVPHYSESASGQKTMDGFAISRIKAGGAAEQVGLRDGDVVQEINGQPLDDMTAVMAVFGRLPTLTQATVRLLRAGQPMTIVINVK